MTKTITTKNEVKEFSICINRNRERIEQYNFRELKNGKVGEIIKEKSFVSLYPYNTKPTKKELDKFVIKFS